MDFEFCLCGLSAGVQVAGWASLLTSACLRQPRWIAWGELMLLLCLIGTGLMTLWAASLAMTCALVSGLNGSALLVGLIYLISHEQAISVS